MRVYAVNPLTPEQAAELVGQSLPQSCALLRVTCCVCGKYLGSKDGRGVSGVSHGLCPECYEKQVAEIDRYFESKG